MNCKNSLLKGEQDNNTDHVSQPEALSHHIIGANLRPYTWDIIKFFHIAVTLFLAFMTVMMYVNLKSTNTLNPQLTYCSFFITH
jgi:hypothetical protein